MKKSIQKVILCLLIIALSVGVWRWIPARYPISSVQVFGAHPHLTQTELMDTVIPYLNDGFFGLNGHDLHDALKHSPWLETVTIRRIWPSRIQIYLEEYRPQVRWNQTGVMSSTGSFIPTPLTALDNALPLLEGPDEQRALVFATYQALNRLLEPYFILQLSLAPWGSWRLQLNNSVEVTLGKTDIQARLQRFLDAMPTLENQKREIATVDLRYTSGFAVGWRTNSRTEQ